MHLARVLLDLIRSLALEPSQHAMMKSRGFTLVELVVVILLLAILAFTAIPRNPGKSINLPGQAHQLAADIRYVQSLSMTRGQRYCFNLTGTGYRFTTAASTCTTAVAHSTGSTSVITLDGVSLSWTNLPNAYVIFSGEGVPYTAAAASLGSDAVITLAGDGGPKTVTISPVTGRVVVGP